MDQGIIYDPKATRDFLEDMTRLGVNVNRVRENAGNAVHSCVQRYERIRGSLESRIRLLNMQLEELTSSQNGDNPPDSGQISRLQTQLANAKTALSRLNHLWSEFYPPLNYSQKLLDDHYDIFLSQKSKAVSTLNAFAAKMLSARQDARNLDSIPTSGPTPTQGWCPQNRLKAVTTDSAGSKTITVSIAGMSKSYPCDMAGLARAYRAADRSGDADAIRITGAMFEVESFRNSLNLGRGDPKVPQLGGYHGDVRKQDPKGYESHHIPAQAVQQVEGLNKDWLPALSISHEDHALTASYKGNNSRRLTSVIPGGPEALTYKDAVIKNLHQGETGYLHSMKCELLDLKDTTGDKYDGAISAYLDAVLDMLSTRGIPDVKTGK